MVNLQQKGEKEAARAAERRAVDLRANGYTVFRYDFAPRFTRRNLSLGDAVRELQRLSGYKISFWRCPVRGLALKYKSPPTSSYLHDKGDSWVMLHFSNSPDETTAKHDLVLDALLRGMEDFRGLPNSAFEEQTDILRALLTAPASAPREEWLALKARLFPAIVPLLASHQADLRQNLL